MVKLVMFRSSKVLKNTLVSTVLLASVFSHASESLTQKARYFNDPQDTIYVPVSQEGGYGLQAPGSFIVINRDIRIKSASEKKEPDYVDLDPPHPIVEQTIDEEDLKVELVPGVLNSVLSLPIGPEPKIFCKFIVSSKADAEIKKGTKLLLRSIEPGFSYDPNNFDETLFQFVKLAFAPNPFFSSAECQSRQKYSIIEITTQYSQGWFDLKIPMKNVEFKMPSDLSNKLGVTLRKSFQLPALSYSLMLTSLPQSYIRLNSPYASDPRERSLACRIDFKRSVNFRVIPRGTVLIFEKPIPKLTGQFFKIVGNDGIDGILCDKWHWPPGTKIEPATAKEAIEVLRSYFQK